jgi:hypothetical protein
MDTEANEDKQDDELEETEEVSEPETADKAEPAVPRKPRWGLWLFVLFLVLALAVVGTGWYASYLQQQVAELKIQLDEAEQKAGNLGTAASAVANELMPLAEENVLVAKLRERSGDPEGTAGALHRAKTIAEMARRLTPAGRPAKLSEIEQQIAEVEAALGGGAEPETSEEEADEGAEEPDEEPAEPAEGAVEESAGPEPATEE